MGLVERTGVRRDETKQSFAHPIQAGTVGGLDPVLVVGRNRNRRQNPDDRHDDQQLDQCKALLGPGRLFHLLLSFVEFMRKRADPSATWQASPVPTTETRHFPPFEPGFSHLNDKEGHAR
jgi:hypothetical protein